MSAKSAEPFTGLLDGIEQRLNKSLESATASALNAITALADSKASEIASVSKTGLKLTVTSDTGTHVITGLKHAQLSELITLIGLNLPVLMVGSAGSGKTHAAEQAAESLGLSFYAMSVGAQTSKSDIIGYMSASGAYVATLFRRAYEHGGVFLMDEVDAGNANVLIQINAALSNNYCAFPDAMVKRHANFRFIGTANTYGNGASRQYVGRNQLDAATLDRFTVLDWAIDTQLENRLVEFYTFGQAWHSAVLAVRDYCNRNDYRVLITPRATLRGAQLLNAGIALDLVIGQAMLAGIPSDKQSNIITLAKDTFKASGGSTLRVSVNA